MKSEREGKRECEDEGEDEGGEGEGGEKGEGIALSDTPGNLFVPSIFPIPHSSPPYSHTTTRVVGWQWQIAATGRPLPQIYYHATPSGLTASFFVPFPDHPYRPRNVEIFVSFNHL